MSVADDLIDKLEKLIKGVHDLDGDFGNAIDEAGDAVEKAQDLGHEVPVGAFTSVRDSLEDLRKPLDELEGEIEKLRNTVKEFGKGI